MTQPVLYMIAGPNGAGKTTAAMQLLPDFLSINEFINADEMARGLNPLNPDGQAIAAGRLMLQRIDALIAARKNFAFETTAASHGFADKMTRAKKAGYRLVLIYLWLPNAALSKLRVKLRVMQGGHNIPAKDIERRYRRGLKNLLDIYLPIVDQANIVDGTLPLTDTPDIIAQKSDADWVVHKPVEWAAIQKYVKDTGDE